MKSVEVRAGERLIIQLASGQEIELTVHKTTGTFATIGITPDESIARVLKDVASIKVES